MLIDTFQISSYGSKPLFEELLKATSSIQDESSRGSFLSKLAPCWPKTLFKETLEITGNIQNEPVRTRTLITLTPHLSKTLFKRALEITRNIQDESEQARALSELAPHLPETLFKEALKTARNIQDEYYCASALQGFLNRLQWPNITFWQEVLKTLATQDRNAFIQNLPQLEPAIIKFGGETALLEIVQAMQAVCTQWP